MHVVHTSDHRGRFGDPAGSPTGFRLRNPTERAWSEPVAVRIVQRTHGSDLQAAGLRESRSDVCIRCKRAATGTTGRRALKVEARRSVGRIPGRRPHSVVVEARRSVGRIPGRHSAQRALQRPGRMPTSGGLIHVTAWVVQNPRSIRMRCIRRAALPRCEMRFLASAVHSPSVRPPGGSTAGSKIGS